MRYCRGQYSQRSSKTTVRVFSPSTLLLTFAVCVNCVSFAKRDLDDCRTIQFTEKIADRALSDHVIQQKQVSDQDMCKVHCFMEPDCVSFNFGDQGDELFLCELNNRSHTQVPDAMQSRIGFIYRPVFNSCQSNPCTNHSTCQLGFGVDGYHCVCPTGYYGKKCELAEPPKVVRCVSVTQLGPTTYEMDANHGSWAAYGFCRVIRMDEINAGEPYTINVDLYNVIGWNGVNSGHLGVLYNVVDEDNFDVFYFRLHSVHSCYQPGYVLNGNFVGSSSSPCSNGPPLGVTWFNVRVEVSSDKNVKIFLDNALVKSQTAHFNTKGRGGVVVANGVEYQNIIRFRDFRLYST